MSRQHTLPSASRPPDEWFYPKDLTYDLISTPLLYDVRQEIFTCAWEYVRCALPQFTNRTRYLAFTRIVIITVVAEFRGDLIDIVDNDRNILGYNLEVLLATVFSGLNPNVCRDLGCEIRNHLLMSCEKTDNRRTTSELFRRYANTPAIPPMHNFRLRDCGVLVRFTIAAALACNDLEYCYVALSEHQLQIFGELGVVLYDGITYNKHHRAGGQVNRTFAFSDFEANHQVHIHREYRKVLSAMDVSVGHSTPFRCVANFLRFLERSSTSRAAEADQNIDQCYDTEVLVTETLKDLQRYQEIMSQSHRLTFLGFNAIIDNRDKEQCMDCSNRDSQDTQVMQDIAGKHTCENCEGRWRRWLDGFPRRAVNAFPGLGSILRLD